MKFLNFLKKKTVFRQKPNDFSDFFDKSSRDKTKVIRQVLREANQEQRKVIDEYKEVVTP